MILKKDIDSFLQEGNSLVEVNYIQQFVHISFNLVVLTRIFPILSKGLPPGALEAFGYDRVQRRLHESKEVYLFCRFGLGVLPRYSHLEEVLVENVDEDGRRQQETVHTSDIRKGIA